jgi:hypothetical protein
MKLTMTFAFALALCLGALPVLADEGVTIARKSAPPAPSWVAGDDPRYRLTPVTTTAAPDTLFTPAPDTLLQSQVNGVSR